MKLLLDEMYSGLKDYFEVMGWEVKTIEEAKLVGAKDKEIVEYAKKHNLPLILGVGAGFLATSTPEAVADRVRHYIEIGGEKGLFALYLCNLGATTPAENVRAAIETVRTYGVYKR